MTDWTKTGDDSPWPAVIVLLALIILAGFIAWLTLGGDCG